MSLMLLSEAKRDDFCAYGDGAHLFRWLSLEEGPPSREVIYEGVAGCGKTRTVCEWLVEVCKQFPGTKVLLFRKTRVSMNESVLDTLETEVLGIDSPLVTDGPTRAHRSKYSFPNGSEIVLGGMDNATRMFSTQYHIAWCNEVQELSEEEWMLLHRALRRPGGPGWHLLGGDCNPDTKEHWANVRCMEDETGRTRALRLVGHFWDNPRYYDWARSEWTREGCDYLEGLCGGLSGPQLQRLFYGKWVAAEGMIWETYDEWRHVIDGRLQGNPEYGWTLWKRTGYEPDGTPVEEPISLRWFMAAHDFGTRNPGALGVIGFDDDGIGYVVAEHYHQGKDYDWWAERAVEFYQEFRYQVGVCDHAPAAIPVFNARCSQVAGRDMPGLWREWSKVRGEDGEKTGIDQVRVRFRQDELFILRQSLRMKDPELARKHKPTCLREEIPQYVYPVTDDGKRHKETPDVGCANHAADWLRAAIAWAFMKDLAPTHTTPGPITAPPGTIEYEYQRRRLPRSRAPKRRW